MFNGACPLPIAAPQIIGCTSQRMKPVSALLAFSLASPLLAARPVAEIERTMKENAYEGTWFERTEKPEGLGAMT